MNFNKAFVLGNVTRDPELRTTPSGQNVCSFSVATNRFFKDQKGERQQQAEFHNIVTWGRLAEICNQYLKKGSLVFVEGRVQTRSWQDQGGQKRYRTELVAENIQLGPRGSGAASGAPSGGPTDTHDAPPPESIDTVQYPGNEDELKPDEIPF